MKKILYLFLFLSTAATFGQDSLVVASQEDWSSREYVPLQIFKKSGIALTRQDSLNFQFYEGDTLVLLQPYMDFPGARGVSVPYIPKDSLFLEIYEDVVFGEVSGTQEEKSTLKLWKDDIRIHFDSSVPTSHRQYLLNFASNLSAGIDSLNISEAEFEEEANYRIIYRNDSTEVDPEPRIRNPRGGYYVHWNARQELERGILKLNTDNISNPISALNYLSWYFFKSLGYFSGSSLLSAENMLAKDSKGSISEKDLEILKYHYSYSNCIGIDRESFISFHKKVRKDLEENPHMKISVNHK